jgi:hypothetical protein
MFNPDFLRKKGSSVQNVLIKDGTGKKFAFKVQLPDADKKLFNDIASLSSIKQ